MLLGYIDPGTGFTFLSGIGGAIIGFLAAILTSLFVFFRAGIKKCFQLFARFLKNKIVRIILIIVVIVVSIWAAKKIVNLRVSNMKKIIILGMDGLDPRFMRNFMEKGELPNFSKLKDMGSSLPLQTSNPPQSPVVWSSIATGQNPGRHGLFDFIRRDPKNYALSLSLTEIKSNKPIPVRRGTPFWSYTSERKIPTTIIGFPVTFPPDKVYGNMLSGMGVPDVLGTEGTFSFYTTESLEGKKDIGGNVIEVKRAPVMHLEIAGPYKKTKAGRIQVKSKFTVSFIDKEKIKISIGKNESLLKAGSWSEWQSVVFPMGFFQNIRGIARFYLVEIAPEFKLYISPVNLDPRRPFFPISYPKIYSLELCKKIGLFYTQGMPCDTWAVNEGRLTEGPFIEQVKEVLRKEEAVLDLELKRLKKGILFCYFETPDIIQHMFWRYIDPQHPLYKENAPQQYKDMIRNWYKKMDDILGRTLKTISDEDLLIVLSDHGFDTFRRAVHVNSWLRKNGYLELKNPDAESGMELLADIDWTKTMAYSIGFGAIYINQTGRERDGIVEPGSQSELLKEELCRKLKEWRDEKYHKKIINNVYKREDIFWGEYVNETPDLYIGFDTGYRASWQTALGGVPKELIEDNLKKWSGDHLYDPSLIPGILFLNKRLAAEKASIYDIVPTILEFLGLEPEQYLKKLKVDGKSLI